MAHPMLCLRVVLARAETDMLDTILVLATLALTGLSIAYVHGCDRL